MRTTMTAVAVVTAAALFGWLSSSSRTTTVFAQEKPAPMGAGTQLPKPDPAFKGKIGETFKDSTPGYPGYTGKIPQSTSVVAQTMRDNGYATAMFGKAHNTPEPEISPAGPFHNWPTGQGFEYFYGFNQGETNQFYPTLYRNTVPVEQPKSAEQGYAFMADMTDEAIAWTSNVRAANPDRPWFNYFSTSGVHAPHQPPKEWREKFKGQFDHGWDKQRELTHAKQLASGIIPKGTKLTPRDKGVPSWESRSADEKMVYTRLMENYAGYMAYTDHEVGRLLDNLRSSGELDNTLVFYVVGDNGASAEGGLEGTFSELASLLGVQLGLKSTINRIDEIGGPKSEPHVPVGWAWAMDAPFQWTKQVASHFGGTRNPLVVHWPKGIKAKGEMRTQFHHVIDVVPTILDCCGLAEPKIVNGIAQKPIEGVSMRYTFDDAKAKSTRTTQYFELATNRAIYHDGWVACARTGYPWVTLGKSLEQMNAAPWELYNIESDFSQAVDLAKENSAKLKELQGKFEEEAKKYGVLPLDPRFSERMDPKLREAGEPPTKWTYHGNKVWLPEPIGPQIFPRGHTITAEIEIPKEGAEGVVTCAGAFSAGWSLYIKDRKPHFRYTAFDVADVNIPGAVEIPAGKVELKSEFTPDPSSKTGGGTLKLFVNGKPAGEGMLTRTFFRHGLEPFEVGRDSITPIDPAYKDKGQFEFSGKIEKVTVDLTDR